MLYKRSMAYFDLQDEKAINGRTRPPLHVIKDGPDFGRWALEARARPVIHMVPARAFGRMQWGWEMGSGGGGMCAAGSWLRLGLEA